MSSHTPKIDYSKKAEIIANTQFVHSIKQFKKECYNSGKMDTYYDLVKKDSDVKQLESILLSYRKKSIRIRKNLTSWLEKGSVIFGTLTFTDDVLQKTSAQTRKRYVERYLKSADVAYIANIDYGSKNDREHYHFIIATGNKNKLDDWQYGFFNLKLVGESESDSTKVSKYVSKLTNHAIKNTNKRCVIMYSKNKNVDCDFEKIFKAL